MIFTELSLPGAFRIDIEPIADGRGAFARTFCAREFEARGLRTRIVQSNASFNAARGTLRGMHFQRAPMAEAKLVRCSRGAACDVIVDLRPGSRAYCRWEAVELTQDNGRMIYIPEGFAHGFQTLEADTEILYQMFEFHSPEHAAGVRWDDPAFGIVWPLENPTLSEKDRSYPPFAR